ncbi:alpha amylase C-terminal domain-containing protein [Arthrobacter sp. RT-1]|uniref:alpha amylase C-terminal domain-containing protein n=1 Tax=Arthrobacter sp. RT-1 TaxID=2292263 RepID=UPI002162D2D3|nr:alpha amylase C-terminal domain-containing protein [Arthrobacter sp. RT-1]
MINDLIVYQFHVGVFSALDQAGRDIRPYRVAKFLDALERIEYLADLGVTAIQPLPLVEFQGEWSLGYNGTDIYSPEMDYCIGPADIAPYLARLNALLAKKGFPPLGPDDVGGQVEQLKAFIDVCHLYGIAVIPDVVYNHAGGGFDGQSIDHFDFPASPNNQNNLYFSGTGYAGGRVFAFDRPEVRQFLIDNASMFLQEYHADGLRFDEVSVIENYGGWSLCQDMTQTLHFLKPSAVLIAEYWNNPREHAIRQPPHGMGFDLSYADGIRNTVRGALAEARAGADAQVDLVPLHHALGQNPQNTPPTRMYNCLENHDLVLDGDGDHRWPRIPLLADATDSRSWYARSRSRVVTGILLTAPGVPMLFMGQEFLEDRLWSDNPTRADRFIDWAAMVTDPTRADFHRCTKDLISLRRSQPALRGGATNSYHVDTLNRVLAFHRWVPGQGRDLVIVISLSESTHTAYSLGFPATGQWQELFNSDYYDHFPNPWVQGNHGRTIAYPTPMHGLPASAEITIPANTILIFAQPPSE